MRGWKPYLVMLSVVLGTGGSVFGEKVTFANTAPGNEWDDAANWTWDAGGSGLPNGTDSDVRIDKVGVVITNGVAATAWNVTVSSFNRAASLTVETGGSLYSKEGFRVGVHNSHGLLDVSGPLTVNPGRSIYMGTTTAAVSGEIIFRSGSSLTTSGNIVLGDKVNAGDFTVNQLGGTISVAEIVIGETVGSTCSGHYSISGGSLSASRLNTGGDGNTTAKFSVVGSDASVSFSGVSSLDGKTELEFILDTNGVSTLDMTGGGYTAAGTVAITVNAADFEGAIGTEFELININSGGSLDVFGSTNLLGGSLDYRADDGLYFVTAALPTIPSTNLWDESFAGTAFNDSWLERGALSTITQSNGLFMTPDANGFARGFLATENYQDQSSGDPAAMFNGKPAYNFFYHDLEITIDGLSMPTDVTDGNLLFIAGVSGDSVTSNDGPRQKLPGAFLRVNSSSNKIDLGMLESTSASRQLLNPKELNDFPDSIVLSLNATGWGVKITGTTFTDGSIYHSGVWNHIDSTVLDANAVLVVGTYNENTATTTSGSREMSIDGLKVNALETGQLVPNSAVLSIDAAGDFVTVGASALTAAATYSLDCSTGLIMTNWTSVGLVSGVSETNWVFQATNPAAFYRMESQ